MWTKIPLGDLCDLIGGGTPAKDNDAFYGGDIPWATIRDMRYDALSTTEFKITKDAVKASATNIIPAGNVVLATRVGLGKTTIVQQDTAINQDLRGIIPKNPKLINIKFLFYWTKSVASIIIDAGTGATVQGVKLPFLRSLEVSLPPPDEQYRIVGILDEAFEGIAAAKAKAEANLRNARELFFEHLRRVFSAENPDWITSELGTHVKFVDYRGKTPPKSESGVRLITAKNVKNGYINLEPQEFVESSAYDDWMTRGFPQKGDVLFTTEAPLGNVAQLDTDEKVIIGQRLITLKPEKNVINQIFLAFLLRSAPVQSEILSRGTGATVIGIKAKLLKIIKISYPKDVVEQSEIAIQLLEIEGKCQDLQAIYQQKSAALDELKNSLLHQAFSGRL